MLCLHPPPPRVQTPQCRADDPTAFVAWGGGGGQPQKCPVLRPVQASTSLIWSSTVRWGPSVQSLRRPAGSMAGTALSIARLEDRFPNPAVGQSSGYHLAPLAPVLSTHHTAPPSSRPAVSIHPLVSSVGFPSVSQSSAPREKTKRFDHPPTRRHPLSIQQKGEPTGVALHTGTSQRFGGGLSKEMLRSTRN